MGFERTVKAVRPSISSASDLLAAQTAMNMANTLISSMPEIFNILSEELQGYTDRLEEIWATDLARVNAELERLGLDPLNPEGG